MSNTLVRMLDPAIAISRIGRLNAGAGWRGRLRTVRQCGNFNADISVERLE